MRNLKRVPLTERLSRVGYLLKHSFAVVRRERDILTPWLRMAIYGAVMTTVFFVGIGGAFYAAAGQGSGAWPWLVLLAAIVMFIYKYFYYNYQEIAQSWLVCQAILGEDKTYSDAMAVARELRSNVRKLALLDMAMAYIARRRSSKEGGLLDALINMVLAGFAEVWDLVNHYLLPASTVDRMRLREGVATIRNLREHVPETLVGVFGIDFIGKVVGTLMAPVYLIAFALAVWLGFAWADWLPAISFAVEGGDWPEMMVTDGRLTLTLIPLLALMFLAKLLSVVFERAVTSVKVIYFTIFYVQIEHPDWIAEELRDELVRYLKMEEATSAGQ